MSQVELIIVPYDSGHRAIRMGRGPLHLLDRGVVAALEAAGHDVTVTWIESDVSPPAEIAVAFELARRIATAVRRARGAGRFPLVLAGNCFSALGTLAGLEPGRTGVLWLDAHGDLNTPETTRSGMLDGMALAALMGRCWRELAATVPGFAPLPHHRLALLGARDLDGPEAAMAAALGIRRLGTGVIGRAGMDDELSPLLTRMAAAVDGFYLHVDLDVLDPEVAPANAFAAPGGLEPGQVGAVIDGAGGAAGILAAAITAFDPDADPAGRAADVAVDIALRIAAAMGAGVQSAR